MHLGLRGGHEDARVEDGGSQRDGDRVARGHRTPRIYELAGFVIGFVNVSTLNRDDSGVRPQQLVANFGNLDL